MKPTEGILLLIIKQFNGERSLSGIFHLMRGKKSSQTLSDGHLFGVSFLFGSFPNLPREEMEEQVQSLLQKKFIQEIEEEKYVVTTEGNESLATYHKSADYLVGFDGLRFKNIERPFFWLLSLYIQTLSHLVRKDSNFLPITRDALTLQLVKRGFPKRENRDLEAKRLYEELQELLDGLPSKSAELFVMRLSRPQKTGLTNRQAAHALELTEEETSIRFRSVLHNIARQAEMDQQKYPVLHRLLNWLETNVPLTASAQKTWKLLKSGRSLEEIMIIRKMKQSTIEDHLVEIAIHISGFSIEDYVSPQEQAEILRTFHSLKTKKLKILKESLGDVSYFKIRLVLGKAGDQFGIGDSVKQ